MTVLKYQGDISRTSFANVQNCRANHVNLSHKLTLLHERTEN